MLFPKAPAKERARATDLNVPASAQPECHLCVASEDQGKGRQCATLRDSTCPQQGCTPPQQGSGWQMHHQEQREVWLANTAVGDSLGGEMSLSPGQLPTLPCKCPAESCIETAKAYNVVRHV